jgi:hypothetical protein
MRSHALLLLPLVATLASCDKVDFNPELYRELCWGPDRCIATMSLEPQLAAWLETSDAPTGRSELRAWKSRIERTDGTFDHLGTSRLRRSQKLDNLDFLLEHGPLVREMFEIVEDELLVQAPVLLARNDADTLARVRVGVAPYLQQTNGSVAVVNDGAHVLLLLGVDRLAFNMVERGRDRTWVRSVVAHELVHVSHFATTTYATGNRDDPPMRRSLWVEGLAVWGSAHAGATTYGLADVFGDDFARACTDQGARWAADYLADLGDDEAFDAWWVDGGPDPRGYGIVTPGYCVAYLTVADLLITTSFEEALTWGPPEAYRAAAEALARVAAK